MFHRCPVQRRTPGVFARGSTALAAFGLACCFGCQPDERASHLAADTSANARPSEGALVDVGAGDDDAPEGASSDAALPDGSGLPPTSEASQTTTGTAPTPLPELSVTENASGLACDCATVNARVDPEHWAPVSGSFELDEELAALASATTLDGAATWGPHLTAMPVYVSDDPWPDIVADSATPVGVRSIPHLYAQVSDGVWLDPVPVGDLLCPDGDCVVPTRCSALADLSGDDAWDLVCLDPFGWFEGSMTEQGHQRVEFSASRWRPGFTEESAADDFVRDPSQWTSTGSSIRFRDFDRDGEVEAVLTTFSREGGDYLLTRNEAGSFDAERFRTGLTFGTCDFDTDGDLVPDAVYAFKEDAPVLRLDSPSTAPSENGYYRVVSGAAGVRLTPTSPLGEGSLDRHGWFGRAEDGVSSRTPMGCSRVPWLAGYYLSQSGDASAIMARTSTSSVCDARRCVLGDGFPLHQWGVTFTSWRGVVAEGVVAHAAVAGTRNATHPGFLGVDLRGRLIHYTGGTPRSVWGPRPGTYYGLVGPFDYTGTGGKPDPLFTMGVAAELDRREPIRLFENKLDRVGDAEILCLELVGRGAESAVVRFEWEGGTAEQLVADGGQVGGSPPPTLFQGAVGPTRVVVQRPAVDPEVFEAVEPGACYTLRPRSLDDTLQPPAHLR